MLDLPQVCKPIRDYVAFSPVSLTYPPRGCLRWVALALLKLLLDPVDRGENGVAIRVTKDRHTRTISFNVKLTGHNSRHQELRTKKQPTAIRALFCTPGLTAKLTPLILLRPR